MATYPNGVYAPASKSAGQTIQASFFNDPEAEITAVEDALKNGIPHAVTINGAVTVSTGGMTVSTGSVNIGGPSSVATLQVNGASTFVGAVTFQGGFSFGGAVTMSSGAVVSTGIVRQDALPAFSVYGSTFVSLDNGSSVKGLNFDVQEFVRGNVGHSTGANSSRITINSTGLYRIDFHGVVTSATDPTVKIRIRLNDTTTLLTGNTGFNTGQRARTVSFGGPLRISSTGYLGVQVTSSAGSTSNIGSSDASQAYRLTGYFLG